MIVSAIDCIVLDRYRALGAGVGLAVAAAGFASTSARADT